MFPSSEPTEICGTLSCAHLHTKAAQIFPGVVWTLPYVLTSELEFSLEATIFPDT